MDAYKSSCLSFKLRCENVKINYSNKVVPSVLYFASHYFNRKAIVIESGVKPD